MTAVSINRLRRSVRDRPATNTTPFVAASAAVIGTLAAVALANRYFAKKAERARRRRPGGSSPRQWEHDPGL